MLVALGLGIMGIDLVMAVVFRSRGHGFESCRVVQFIVEYSLKYIGLKMN